MDIEKGYVHAGDTQALAVGTDSLGVRSTADPAASTLCGMHAEGTARKSDERDLEA